METRAAVLGMASGSSGWRQAASTCILLCLHEQRTTADPNGFLCHLCGMPSPLIHKGFEVMFMHARSQTQYSEQVVHYCNSAVGITGACHGHLQPPLYGNSFTNELRSPSYPLSRVHEPLRCGP